MKQVKIYVDSNDRLTLQQFNSDATKRELILTDEDVYFYLDKISSDKIANVEFTENDKGITGVNVLTNNRHITLHNLRKLEKHEELLAPLSDKIERKLENDKIRSLKTKRTTKPKVTRENKHSNKHIKLAGALLLIGTVIAGAVNQHLLMPISDISSLPDDKPALVDDNSLNETTKNNISNDKEQYTHIDYSFQDGVVTIPSPTEAPPEVERNELPTVEFDYEDRSNTEKARFVVEEYGDLLTKYANRYGVDPNLMIAIATQERGIHSSEMDTGGATGLMQIQNAVWLGDEISAHNFETGKKDKFTVTEDMIKNLETNIQLGCMYFQNCLDYMNYNIPAAIQCYNMGYGNMDKILCAYAEEQGITKTAVLTDATDTGWMNHRYLSAGGDDLYFEHVSSWLNDNSISVLNRKDGNNEISINITNNSYHNTL